jgi:hypothetical protein
MATGAVKAESALTIGAGTSRSKLQQSGEDVLIAGASRPVARPTRVRTGRKGIKLGTLKGMFKKVSAEFDAPLQQSVLAEFGDGPLEP